VNRQKVLRPKSLQAPPVVRDVLRSSGQPLDTETRTFMESRFGHDFSRVRVHTNEKASMSAQAINALAFTVGSDIAVRNDQYAPATFAGRNLLAHELAHVVQQSRSPGGSEPESRADQAARAVMSGQQAEPGMVGAAAPGLYRQHDKSEPDDDFLKLLLYSARHQKTKGMIPEGSPLLGDPSPAFSKYKPGPIPPWVKSGIDLRLPGEKSKRPEGLGFSHGDLRFSVRGAGKGDPKIPGDSLEDFIQEKPKIDLTPQGLFLRALSSGELAITKKIVGKKQKNIAEQKRKIKIMEAEGWMP
jgi:hypothetical protein